MQKITDIIPAHFAKVMTTVAKAKRHWVEVVEGEGTTFGARAVEPFEAFQSGCDNARELLGLQAVSIWLADGPKVFRPTVDQCRALEQVDLRLKLADYAQPYPALMIELPEGLYPPFAHTLLHYEWNVLTCQLLSKDKTSDVCTCIKHTGNDIEMDITRFDPGCDALVENASKVYRVGLNSCLALVNFGFRKELLLKKQGDADRKLAGEQSERGARARARLKEMVSLVSFTQEITLHESHGPRLHGEPTGAEVQPHWRRGHWRMQRHGPKNSLQKRILIKPVLVRADKFIGDVANTSTVIKGQS